MGSKLDVGNHYSAVFVPFEFVSTYEAFMDGVVTGTSSGFTGGSVEASDTVHSFSWSHDCKWDGDGDGLDDG